MRYALRNYLGGDRHDHLETHHHGPTRIASAPARRRKPERDCADDACQPAHRREVSPLGRNATITQRSVAGLDDAGGTAAADPRRASAATASERIQFGTVSHRNQRTAGARSRNHDHLAHSQTAVSGPIHGQPLGGLSPGARHPPRPAAHRHAAPGDRTGRGWSG